MCKQNIGGKIDIIVDDSVGAAANGFALNATKMFSVDSISIFYIIDGNVGVGDQLVANARGKIASRWDSQH